MTLRMLSTTAQNWDTKSAFWWFGTSCLCAIWTFFLLPETGGFTFEELYILFENRVPTWHFRKVVLTPQGECDYAVWMDRIDKKTS